MGLPPGATIFTRSSAEFAFLPGKATALPSKIEARLEHPSIPTVEVSIVVDQGRPVIASVSLTRSSDGDGLKTADLRAVPLHALLSHVIAAVEMPARMEDGRLVIQVVANPSNQAGGGGDPDPASDAVTSRPSRRRVDPALLGRLVALYREEVAKGNPRPRVSVGAALGMSSAHIGNLLDEARRSGLLGPARPGRAGEVSSPTKEKRQ